MWIQICSWQCAYRGLLSEHYLASLDTPVRQAQWKMAVQNGIHRILLVEDHIGIFGFASGGEIRQTIEGYDAELYSIYLLKEKQRLGVGRALVHELAGRLGAEGFNSLAVWTLSGNSARGFYEALGGVLIARTDMEIGGELIPKVAYGWPSLSAL